ncbi:MAG: TIGR00645 family protein [Sphingomonas sp.]
MPQPLERAFENALFAARWLLAPFYVGLVAALLVLLAVFTRELVTALGSIMTLSIEQGILKVLALLDLALAANLILVVILAGYENFVSKIDTAGHEDRPSWMGTTGFSGLKIKLYASIVAISGIQLLKSFMAIGDKPVDGTALGWMTVIHLTFVGTALFSALSDYLQSRAKA